MTHKTVNNDSGSLLVGVEGASLVKGNKIRVVGEEKVRTISYVMGQSDKTHVCTKGFGPFPSGPVEWEVVQ